MARGRPKKQREVQVSEVIENESVENGTPSISHPVAKSARTGNVIVAMLHNGGMIFRLSGDREVRLNGTKKIVEPNRPIPVGEWGHTSIPVADWEEIKERYGWMKIFKGHASNGYRPLIHEVPDMASFEDFASDNKDARHGLEPVDVDNDPRWPVQVQDSDAGGKGHKRRKNS